MTLNERKRTILESIIKDYVGTAEPVGSRAVAKRHDLKISAATIRNEMADLEDMGYLEQPHTSAGRIPSETGFRYYVDCMMEKETLCDEELDLLYKVVKDNIEEWNDTVSGIGNFLAQVTNYASFIIVPSIKLSEFKHLQVVPMEHGKAMVLIVTDLGLIMHRKIDVPKSVSYEDLQIIGDVFNRVFRGKKLEDMRRSDLHAIRDDLKNRRKVIDIALEAIDSLLQNSGEDRVVISGALNILNEPEFKDLEKLKTILRILETDRQLRDIIPNEIGEEVDIKIGKENPAEEIKEMSLVIAGYKTFGEMGKMGVIGPVRMEYWKAAGTVESVRTVIEDIIKQYF